MLEGEAGGEPGDQSIPKYIRGPSDGSGRHPAPVKPR